MRYTVANSTALRNVAFHRLASDTMQLAAAERWCNLIHFHFLLINIELLIDPLPQGNFVHYDFLKLHYIRNKMTRVDYLAVGALPCNSHAQYVSIKRLQIILFKYKTKHTSY